MIHLQQLGLGLLIYTVSFWTLRSLPIMIKKIKEWELKQTKKESNDG